MRPTRVLLLVTVLALALNAAPLRAAEPAACGGRAYPLELADGEVLVERTLYFTGENRIGNVDGNNNPNALQMTEEEPTGDETKAYVSRAAALGNPTIPGNAHHGFFAYEFDQPTRVVCASVEFDAVSASSGIQVALFADGGGAANEFNATAPSSGEGLRHYQGTFGNVETTAWDLLVQFNTTNPAGATVLYDSAEYPSALTVVTVE